MQKFAGSCTPDQLHTLQRVFDLIWMELRANGHANYTGPSDPDLLRDEIARRVLGAFNGGEVDAAKVTERVLMSFGVHTDGLYSQKATTDGVGKQRANGRFQEPL
jgi:hypothetical protein